MLKVEFNLEDAKSVWLEEGREEGAERKALELAATFLSMGIAPKQIAQGTGLSLEKIMSLLHGVVKE